MWCWFLKKVEKAIKKIKNLDIKFCVVFLQVKTQKGKDIYSINCQNKWKTIWEKI